MVTFSTENTYRKVQQTPNPAAQFPSPLPPLLVHSDLEKQVPNTSTEPEDFPVHWLKRKNIISLLKSLIFVSVLTYWEKSRQKIMKIFSFVLMIH